MPGKESLDNLTNESELDSLSSSSEVAETLDDTPLQEAAPPEYFCVYQIGEKPMAIQSFNDLHSMVMFIREESLKPGFRLFVFEGSRLATTRFPAPHLILPDGERVPLFDTRIAYSADSDGFIGPPAAAVSEQVVEPEPNPFRDNRRRT